MGELAEVSEEEDGLIIKLSNEPGEEYKSDAEEGEIWRNPNDDSICIVLLFDTPKR